MGVDVELRRPEPKGPGSANNTRRRPRITSTVIDEMIDGDDVFVRLLGRVYGQGRTPLLDKIDPYGDLRMNSANMPQFLAELTVLETRAGAADEHQVIADLRRLAHACAQDAALRLLFVGD
jgi:hypothetical protein